MSRKYKEIIVSLIPTLIFLISFRIALICGFVICTIIYISKYKKYKSLSSFDYLGIFGLVSQTIIGYLAKNPMTYFIYPLIENILYMIVFAISLIVKKDDISFLAKDYVESDITQIETCI